MSRFTRCTIQASHGSGVSGSGCKRVEAAVSQAELGTRDVPLITVAGLKFKDLNRNGRLDPYEDWRLPPARRAADLLKQVTLREKAGVMLHGTLPAEWGW